MTDADDVPDYAPCQVGATHTLIEYKQPVRVPKKRPIGFDLNPDNYKRRGKRGATKAK